MFTSLPRSYTIHLLGEQTSWLSLRASSEHIPIVRTLRAQEPTRLLSQQPYSHVRGF